MESEFLQLWKVLKHWYTYTVKIAHPMHCQVPLINFPNKLVIS